MEKTKKIMKPLQVLVKDRHIPLLRFLAREVHRVWNAAKNIFALGHERLAEGNPS